MALDLRSVSSEIEDLMEDEVRVWRPASDDDKVFNEVTGEYDDPGDTTLYEGQAMINTMGQEPRTRLAGGVDVDDTLYQFRIPTEDGAPRILRNDRCTVITCNRSPTLEGLELRVLQEIHGTFSVTRRVHATLQTLSDD